ncbi:hypothetical protein PanWU01x14_251390 [Parasponia andersonii]|uniref:Uncharacterized protein n=1 Tax=Parasponia andersonii TaxID=3476 RepID=A0A2P5BCH2_PARAD|nr:hypothetical protein PanWU01x14_251390 [Parasponia andersonii]
MWGGLATLGQNLQNIRKSPRVADESMFGGGNNQAELPIIPRGRSPARWKGFAVIFSVLEAPILSLFSCFSQPPHPVNGGGNITAYGVWATGEFAQISEMNHLMVSDSMRYAILM